MKKISEWTLVILAWAVLPFLLLNGKPPAEAQSTSSAPSYEVLDNIEEPNALPTLNNMLRQQATATQQLQGYFNSNGFLSPASGGTGTNITNFPNGSILVYNATNVGIGTFAQAPSGQLLQSGGVAAYPSFTGSPSVSRLTSAGNIISTSGNIGIGTPTPGSAVDVNGDIRLNMHIITVGTSSTPSISSCGSGASLLTGSTDLKGQVTVGNATPCQINFGKVYGATPICLINDTSTPTRNSSISVATTTSSQLIISGTYTNSDNINWICIG